MSYRRLSELLDSFLNLGIPGVDCVVYREHEPVFRHCAGFSDLERQTPITGNETYFMFSCTKVVTCAAALTLLEQGCFLLTDPLDAYIPEFSQMFLANGERAKNKIKIRDLFTMSAGFHYDVTSPSVTQAIRDKNGRATTLDIVRAVAKEPLSFEPGAHWQYSLCHDVLAGLVEVLAGKRFGDYVSETIFDPIGMTHTSFGVTERNEETLAPLYRFCDETNRAELQKKECSYILTPDYDSGGAGMVSSVDDYILFADAMANGGIAKNGCRILSPATIDLMRTDCLTGEAQKDFNWIQHAGYGYGLGVRTMNDLAEGGAIGSVGEFGWGGAAGSYCLIDPNNRISLFYAQHMLNNKEPFTHPRLRNVLYACASTQNGFTQF